VLSQSECVWVGVWVVVFVKNTLTHSAHAHSSKRSVPLSTALVCRRAADAVMSLSRCRACTTTKRVSGEQAGKGCGRVGGWVRADSRGRKVKVAALRLSWLGECGPLSRVCNALGGTAEGWCQSVLFIRCKLAACVCLAKRMRCVMRAQCRCIVRAEEWDVWDVCTQCFLCSCLSACLCPGLNSATKSAQEGVLAVRCVGDHSTRPNQQRRG
jgi:hypothetical protein